MLQARSNLEFISQSQYATYLRGTHADEYAQWRYTKTNTNPNPDPDRYRRRCPDPNARIQKFIHYMATTPQLQNSM